ncbi:DEAD/DEAH box helicase [Streptomyces sp. NEAU-H22]|uniref:DEAD/DEAH box helicase n=1 Tax=unclassified Streptomyces TaxID=2593676 RepID=UPI002250E385|nr:MULTISPECIES: DEAD/DEAH box helicase [unclassified Streptomyces]MCX3288246.1 DEAD/DEAH box helicase [Streptomyces sp. NEAU-H22]WMD07249.1 DEAD/DEAH box helicase [Streptomyces sp. FXY-T5]
MCRSVFLPGDPARTGSVAFWRPDGSAPPDVDSASVSDLTVALPHEGGVQAVGVPAVLVPVRSALPVLTRARAGGQGHRSTVFWGAAALYALHLVARGLLLPGLSPGDHDAWRTGPLRAQDIEAVRRLAAAMPPEAHATPLEGVGPLLLPDPEQLLRAFLDAVADTLPRSPAAPLVTGGPAYAEPEPVLLPEQRAWAADVAAGHDAGLRLSLRIEADGLTDAADADADVRFRAVLQVHSVSDPALVADAADVWAGAAGEAFGPRARMDALLALRRAARAWAPLTPLLSAAVPDAAELADEEVTDLLGAGAHALGAAGVEVHWPKGLSRELSTHAEVGPSGGGSESGREFAALPSFLSADALLAFTWSFAVGDRRLDREELDRLAEAKRPLVRLRDQWVLLDPREARLARSGQDRKVTPVDALGAALTGWAEVDGRRVEVRPTGWLKSLRERLADPEAQQPVEQPAALAATLRDYQRRGLNWLAGMTSLGLGCCLADDMGLGKTITLIALHLHRQSDAGSAGPTLVVCPTSLMGNWQREIERFAPGTPVRRFHGARRGLDGLADGEFVLTTYGTMRLDAPRLAHVPWGMLVADEAQHVKNPYSSTARELRSIGARARVALTGTPVENNLSELWAILDWTTPGLLGRLGTFRRRYAEAVEGGQDPAAADRLARLVRPFLLRRRKSDPGIAPELPPKTETDHAVSLTGEQAALYEAVVREALAEISGAGSMARRGLIVKLLTGLKQICNHPAQYLKEERPVISGRSGKLELLDELLDTILAEEAGVLVFTQYVQMARLLERHLTSRGTPSQFLYGGTPVAEREAMVRRFQDGEVPVFLLSLKAAGTGLNLTRAEHVVHYDRWWNPAVEAQATDRAYRIGQLRPVQVHRIIAEGTIEDRIAELLLRKRKLADAVLGAGEAALTELTDAELADLVALRGGLR